METNDAKKTSKQNSILKSISFLNKKNPHEYGNSDEVNKKKIKKQIIIIILIAIIFIISIAGGGYLIWYTQQNVIYTANSLLANLTFFKNCFTNFLIAL